MKAFPALSVGFLACGLFLFSPATAGSQVSVLTHHNDTSRTGQNLNETLLTTGNVQVNNFGKLFSRTIDGQMYAQPLYVPNLTIQGSVRNVVYAATEHNSVYAYDADDPNATLPLWQVNLGPSVPTNDVCLFSPTDPNCPNQDAFPEYGITATPVIDAGSNTIYVVAKTKSGTASYHYQLHALDLISGAEKFGGPVEIAGQLQGSGIDNSGGTVSFDPVYQGNRPGLLLMNGVVYTAFASVGEVSPWHGWVFGYNAGTLQQVALYNSTPDGAYGGIWGGGNGLLGVGGNIYVMTGNGTFDANSSGRDYGDSFIKLNATPALSVADYFTPYNQSSLDSLDLDLGSGGPMALPGTGLIAGSGKDGTLRLLNTANLGQFHATFNNDVQEFPFSAGIFMGGPIYWNSPNNGPVIYLWGSGDYLKAFKFSGGSFQTTPVSQGSMQGTPGYSNSAPLSLSANGSQAGSGIVWASAPLGGDANQNTVSGILRAFDAGNLSQELWNSQQNPARDSVGSYAKFSPPTIANGKVYLATFSGQLLAYGLNPPPVAPLPTPWVGQDIGNVGLAGSAGYTSGTFTVTGSGADIEDAADAFQYVYQPLAGDGQIVARVVTQQDTDPWAKAGVMIRETITASSTQAMMVITPGNGAAFQRRLTTGGTTLNTSGPAVTAPYWVKMVRSGSTFSGSISVDGVNWMPVGTDTIGMANSVYVGLAVTSHNNAVLCTATMDGVNVTGTVLPTVSITAPANGASYGAPATVAITAAATASTGATVSRVDFYAGATPIGSATAAPYGISWNNVPAGSYSLTAQVTDSSGKTAASTPVAITVSANTPAIAFLQVAAAVPKAAQTVALAYPLTQTAGNLNIVVVGWNDTTSSVQSVTDSLGNVYALAAGPITGTDERQAIYYAPGIKGGSNQVTVTFNQSAAYPDIRVLEYSGVGAPDKSIGASGNSSTSSSGSVTTTAANELIFSANTVATLTRSAGAGFTQRIITSPDGDLAQDQIVSSTGSYGATATLTTDGPWVMQTVTFSAAANGSPTVSITAPANGASYSAPATVAITATAAAGTGATVSRVDFYAGATPIGSATSAPYAISWNNVPAGNYSLTAQVTDSSGRTAGSTPVAITVSTGTPTIAFLQVAAAVPKAAQTVALAYPLAQTAGNLNIVVVGWNDTTSSVQSVTDSIGNVYALAAGPIIGSDEQQSIYYAPGIRGGSNQVTVIFNQSAAYPDIRILEYSGVSTPDKSIGASGNSSTSSSGSVTTTAAKELIFSANTVATLTRSAGVGFTQRIITSPDGDLAQDQIVGSTGSYAATAPLSQAGPWVMQTVTFSATANGSPTVSITAPANGASYSAPATVPITATAVASTGATVSRVDFYAGATPIGSATTAPYGISWNNVPAGSYSLTAQVTDSSGKTAGSTPVAITVSTSPPAIAFVQVAAAVPSAAQTVALAYPLSQTAGNLNIVVVGWNDTSSSVQSVADSLGNVYTLAAGPITGLGQRQSIYFAKGIRGGSNRVTVTFNQSAAYPDIRILEYSGVGTLDKSIGASGNSSTSSTGAVTTTAANELIFSANTVATTTRAAGTGFTQRIITSPDGDLAQDGIVGSVGAYSASAPLTSAGGWVMQMVTFS